MMNAIKLYGKLKNRCAICWNVCRAGICSNIKLAATTSKTPKIKKTAPRKVPSVLLPSLVVGRLFLFLLFGPAVFEAYGAVKHQMAGGG